MRRRTAAQGKVVWQGEWTDASGKRRRLDLGATKLEAEQALAEKIRARDLELQGRSIEGGMLLSVEQLVEQYLAELATRAAPRTVAEWRKALNRVVPEIGAPAVRDMRPERVLAWRQRRIAQGVAHKTINNELAPLRSAFALAVRLGQIRSNPLSIIDNLPIDGRHQRRPARALAEWELAQLIEVSRAEDKILGGFPRTSFILGLALTGARYGELRALTWSDVDLKRGSITFRGETTKNGHTDTVPIHPQLQAELERLPGEHARVNGRLPSATTPVFLAPNGGPWHRISAPFHTQLMRLYKLAGIPRRDDRGRVANVHTLRHTFVTRCARAGLSPQKTARLSRHRTIEVVARVYTHLEEEDAREAIECLQSIGVVANLPTAVEGPGDPAPSNDALPNEREQRAVREYSG